MAADGHRFTRIRQDQELIGFVLSVLLTVRFFVFSTEFCQAAFFMNCCSGCLTGDEEDRQEDAAGFADLIEMAARDFMTDAVSAEEPHLAADQRGAAFGLA
jgi:hypothetical protein